MQLDVLKVYLPAYLLLYVLLTFVISSVRIYRKTGINPITFGAADNAHDYIGGIMKVLTAMLTYAVLAFSFSDALYSRLVPIGYLYHPALQVAGLGLIHASLVWIVVAQQQMGLSWRIGIDEANRTPLVSNGIFGLSRNPIFLGMVLSLLGLFLIIPNIITFFTCLCSYFVIQIQVRLEEEFLLKQHGEAYTAYQGKVRRWL